jgi:hypothetical protein
MNRKINERKVDVSRRTLLLQAAAAAGAVPVLALGVQSAAAKMAQSGVAYQMTPNGGSRCGGCKMFEAPSSCKMVDGQINPDGWCKLWLKAA